MYTVLLCCLWVYYQVKPTECYERHFAHGIFRCIFLKENFEYFNQLLLKDICTGLFGKTTFCEVIWRY